MNMSNKEISQKGFCDTTCSGVYVFADRPFFFFIEYRLKSRRVYA